jgi:hypothetical protein
MDLGHGDCTWSCFVGVDTRFLLNAGSRPEKPQHGSRRAPRVVGDIAALPRGCVGHITRTQ